MVRLIGKALANSNIAIIKYWGNANNALVIPANNSLSFTMDNQLQTRTKVIFSDEYAKDELWINGTLARKEEIERVSKFLSILRKKINCKLKAKVYSRNSFPKGAGLASSAAGFAALAGAASKALGLKLTPKELSSFARFGSGSAARSIFGGAVEWKKGKKKDGSDCCAVQLVPKEKLSKLRNVIAIVEKKEKKVGSRKGMEFTVKTSRLFKKRVKAVKVRLKEARKAILNFDFQKLAPIIMEDSNSMHEVMRDTKPKLEYLSPVSYKIIGEILSLNKEKKKFIGAYTFDAGPNAHIYTLEENVKEIVKRIKRVKEIKKIIVCKIGEGIRILK